MASDLNSPLDNNSSYLELGGYQAVAGEVTKDKLFRLRANTIRLLILASLTTIISIKTYSIIFVIDPVIGSYGFIATFMIFVPFLISYTRYKDPSSSSKSTNFLVTAIVPAKNEPIMIKATVNAILSSSYKKIKIILVNDGSTDETGDIMDSMQEQYPEKISVIHLKTNVGKRKAMREAILNSDPQTEIFVVIDSDSVVEKTAIGRLVSVFDDAEVGAVTGHGRAINADKGVLTRMQDTWYDGQFSIMKGFENCFGNITCCSGCLTAYRKEAIMPCLDAWSNDRFLGSEFRFGDDRHLTSYILGGSKHYIDKAHKKWKTKYCDSAIVFTEAPSSLKKFFRQQIRWKKSWLRVFCFNAPFYYKDRHPLIAAYFYLQVCLSLLTPIVAFRALVILPLQQQYLGMIAYIAGIFFIGLLYAFDFKARNPGTGNLWLYRILLTMMNMFMTGYLLYYSLLTIKKMSWLTR